jgi:5-methylcytosine-specific restriction protein A
MCARMGRIEPAVVADHVEPHKGDINKFMLGALAGLCLVHHNASKQREEVRGYSDEIGADGWPTDVERHPVYRCKQSLK